MKIISETIIYSTIPKWKSIKHETNLENDIRKLNSTSHILSKQKVKRQKDWTWKIT